MTLHIVSGVNYKGKSIFEYGTVSTCSFHATKIFHTGEGGAIFTSDIELHNKLFYHHNFGHKGQEDFHGLGINAKMSELQAAMGLSVLPFFNKILQKRKELYNTYEVALNGVVKFQKMNANTDYNYSYMPVIFKTEAQLLKCINILQSNNIFPRRYFFPSLNTLKFVNGKKMPESERISSTILCLPLYFDLKKEDVIRISNLIINTIINEC